MRRLRDLCLVPTGIELGGGERVLVEGCLSADQPVERGVHYALEHLDGRRHVLAMRQRTSAIELSLAADGQAAIEGAGAFEVELATDRFGRIMAPALSARIDLAVCDPRAIEHFLRRLVRAAVAGSPR